MTPDPRHNYHWYCSECGYVKNDCVPELNGVPKPGQKNCPECGKRLAGYPKTVQGPPRHPYAKY